MGPVRRAVSLVFASVLAVGGVLAFFYQFVFAAHPTVGMIVGAGMSSIIGFFWLWADLAEGNASSEAPQLKNQRSQYDKEVGNPILPGQDCDAEEEERLEEEAWRRHRERQRRPVAIPKPSRMTTQNTIGVQAVEEMHQLWQVDADFSQWTNDLEGYGFDWWPGEFKIEVRVSGHHGTEDPAFRLSVRTAFLRDVDANAPKFFENMALLNRLAPTYALCCPESSDGKVFLQSTAYLHGALKGWLPRFFAGQTILQPIEAQFRAEAAARLLGGQPDRSRTRRPDEMLEVETSLYVPAGKDKSRWAGTSEFQQIVEKWGRSGGGFGTADETGLTFETPFGNSSAMLQLFTDQPHPILGNGLLGILRFPFSYSEGAADKANSLNCLEASSWVSAPLMGSWSSDHSDVAFATFVPNLLYQRGLAENVVIWNCARAHWVRQTFFPQMVDLPMHEVLARRIQSIDALGNKEP